MERQSLATRHSLIVKRLALFLAFLFMTVVTLLESGPAGAERKSNEDPGSGSFIAQPDWREYEDPFWSFSIAYPSGWSIQNIPYQDFGFRINSPDLETTEIGSATRGAYLAVNAVPMTREEWETNRFETNQNARIVSREEFTIPEGLAEQITGFRDGQWFRDYLIFTDGYYYRFSFNQDVTVTRQYSDIAEQMLASIRLLGEPTSYPAPDYAALGIDLEAFSFPPIRHAFPNGPGKVINGYEDGAWHTGSDRYALDICEGSGCVKGVAGEDYIIAPTDLRFIKTASNALDYHILEVDKDDAHRLCLSLGHFYFAFPPTVGRFIPRGAALATLSSYGSGSPHIHMGLWTVPSSLQCNQSPRVAVPFDEGAGGFELDGVNYPIGEDHENKTVTSTNAAICSHSPGTPLEECFQIIPGDANRNGQVDLLDYVIIFENFSRTGSPGFSRADFNYDGRVDLLDYIIFYDNFGASRVTSPLAPEGSFLVDTVPEPPANVSFSYDINRFNTFVTVRLHWDDNSSNESGFDYSWDIDDYAARTITELNDEPPPPPTGEPLVASFDNTQSILTVLSCENEGAIRNITGSISAFNQEGSSVTVSGTGSIPIPACPIPGDANYDRKVDGIDFSIWLNNFGYDTMSGPAEGDYNYDLTVDGIDFSIWLNNFGYGRGGTAPLMDIENFPLVPQAVE